MDHPCLSCSCSPHTGSRVYAAEGTGRRVRSRSQGQGTKQYMVVSTRLRPGTHSPCEEGPQEGWLRRSGLASPLRLPEGLGHLNSELRPPGPRGL